MHINKTYIIYIIYVFFCQSIFYNPRLPFNAFVESISGSRNINYTTSDSVLGPEPFGKHNHSTHYYSYYILYLKYLTWPFQTR